MNLRKVVALALLLIAASAVLAIAEEIPGVMNYQGKLTDSENKPLNRAIRITFTIYDAPEGGKVLWTEKQDRVSAFSFSVCAVAGDLHRIRSVTCQFCRRYCDESLQSL